MSTKVREALPWALHQRGRRDRVSECSGEYEVLQFEYSLETRHVSYTTSLDYNRR